MNAVSSDTTIPYDSFLLVSFGGPESPGDVMPFLENVLRGKNVPRQRMLEVAEHYMHFGGISPINSQCRELIAGIEAEFRDGGIDLPVYWGNRNWHPLLTDTLAQMKRDGRRRSLAFFTSMFSCYSGCRQYRENITDAHQQLGETVPQVDKLRMGFNHPLFIATMTDAVLQAVGELQAAATDVDVLFTAHSIPLAMAEHCDYEMQLLEASRLVAEASGTPRWRLVYQSRSGPPSQPWLEPDICDAIAELDDANKLKSVVIAPIGFVSDHMEVMFDLDEQAAQLCDQRGIAMARAATAGTHPKFVRMIRQLVEERLGRRESREAVGQLGPWHDVCPADCCLYTPRRAAAN